MFLNETELKRSQELVKAAFPRFSHWQFANNADEYHSGFSIWGEYTVEHDDTESTTFFATFDAYGESWNGHLSVGKHAIFGPVRITEMLTSSIPHPVKLWKLP